MRYKFLTLPSENKEMLQKKQLRMDLLLEVHNVIGRLYKNLDLNWCKGQVQIAARCFEMNCEIGCTCETNINELK